MTFSILSSPELGIPRWPLQTHTLPSASMLCVLGGCCVGNTHRLPRLAGSIGGAEEQSGEENEWGTLFPCCLSVSGGLCPSTDSLAPQAGLSSQLSPGSGSCSLSCLFKPGGGDSTLFYFFKYLFIYLAASGLRYGTQDLRCIMQDLLMPRSDCLLVAWALVSAAYRCSSCGLQAYSSACGILSSLPRNLTRVFCIAGQILHHWAIGKFQHPRYIFFFTNETV